MSAGGDSPQAPGRVIDLNADVGEGVTDDGDGELLALVSSASVACGFHAGDATTMRTTCATVARHDVRLGAHVSYDDREGFGRRELDLPVARITDDAVYQLGALIACAALEGGLVSYVKPHGALYARANRDPALAVALVAAIAAVGRGIAVMAPPGSAIARAAAAHSVAVIAEGFADRGYAPDGALLPRSRPGALLEPDGAARQALALARDGVVTVAGGQQIPLRVQSLCVHSDTPGALAVATAVRDALSAAGVRIAATP